MGTTELKNELINRISEIDDLHFLNTIKVLLDNKATGYIYLTNEQEEELLRVSEEGKSGKYITQDEMDKKVDKWLKEK